MTGRIITGYAARWALLALTVGLIVSSLAAAMAATGNLVFRPDGQVYLSDALQFGPDHKRQNLLGHFRSSTDRWEVPYVLVRTGGQRVEIQDIQADDYMILHFNEHIVGPRSLSVGGLPYSREALLRWPVEVYGTTPGEQIIFIDTALFASTSGDERESVSRILSPAGDQGVVVMLSGGVGEQLVARDRLVAEAAPEQLHLSTHPWGTNALLRSRYKDTMLAYDIDAQLITAEWQAAKSASNAGLAVHYIAIHPQPLPTHLPAEGPPKRWKNITIYRSIDEFLAHYAR